MSLKKIISGGQTGVDRAALDFILNNPQLKIACGGWCPKGRKAEDGIIPAKYPLKETNTSKYAERTELNVKYSDGTLIIFTNTLDKGTLLTKKLAMKYNKPIYVYSGIKEKKEIKEIKKWLKIKNIKTLNIAGPRESNAPGIYKFTYHLLEKLLL